MSPFRFELSSLSRARGAWAALAVACAPAAFALLAMIGMRRWSVSSEMLARGAWPLSLALASMAQAALMPLLQMYILGDALAGQVADRRLRSLLVCPVSYWSLYLGKLGAAFAFAAAALVVSMALHVLGALAATAGTDWSSFVSGRGYHVSLPLMAVVVLAAQLALIAYEGFVFSIAGSLKSGLLGVAGLTAALLAVQIAATRAAPGWQWLCHCPFTYHYVHGLGADMWTAASTAKLVLDAEYCRLLAALLADVLVFGSLGYWAFRHREV